MNQTRLMRADEIAAGFNTTTERQYWKAVVAGTRVNPEVHFNSRASMVRVVYRIASEDFTVAFSKASTAFGDYLASAHRSLAQVLVALKAAGLPFAAPLDDAATLRLEYDPSAKSAVIHMARLGDAWCDAEPLPFKVPERENSEKSENPLDAPEYDL